MSDATGRRFDDDEVSLILRRAAEMQEAQTGVSSGMTLADLEQVAREAGLDPALVRRAAADIDVTGGDDVRTAGTRFLGTSPRLRYERVIEGELSPNDYEQIVDEARRALNDVGMVSALGRTLAWRSTPVGRRGNAGARDVSVTVVARNGRTGIRVEESATALAGGVFGGLMGGLGGGGGGMALAISMATTHSPPLAVGLWLACVASGYGIARGIFGAAMQSRARALRSLADRLAAVVDESVRGARIAAPSGAEESR